MYLLIKIPTNIADKKIKVTASNNAIEDTAGPGHNPTNPHPIPNKEDPIKIFLSKSFFCGKLILKPKEEVSLFFIK